MKAIVVKDNSFQTIGFEVTQGPSTLLQWGVSPHSRVFVKEVEVKDWAIEIFELVRLQSIIAERESFLPSFFQVASKSKVEIPVDGIDFAAYKENTKRLVEKFEIIVQNII